MDVGAASIRGAAKAWIRRKTVRARKKMGVGKRVVLKRAVRGW